MSTRLSSATETVRLWVASLFIACVVITFLIFENGALGKDRTARDLRLSASDSIVNMQAGELTDATLTNQTKQRDQETGWEYWEYRPAGHANAEPGRKWPLILFLHGAGESGHDLDKMISIGATGCPPVELASGNADPVLRENFVVASPQTARGWGDAAAIATFVDNLIGSQELGIDKDRVYCTGVSMGGAGTWVAGTTKLFAAIAPVCGAGSVPPESLAGVPVWAFHGANDIVVPVRVTDKMVETLQATRSSEVGEAEVKYTRYDASPAPTGWEDYTGHASWIPAYEGPELWTWLLEHSKDS